MQKEVILPGLKSRGIERGLLPGCRQRACLLDSIGKRLTNKTRLPKSEIRKKFEIRNHTDKRQLLLWVPLIWLCLSNDSLLAAADSDSSKAKPQSQQPAKGKYSIATLQELRGRLTEHISQAKYTSAIWGVKVVSLDSGKTLFEHNASKLLTPASNTKLYTVALALDELGPDYRIKTSLYSKAKPDASGNLRDDLIIYGRGDPTISSRTPGSKDYDALGPFVKVLRDQGVKQISGNIIGDCSLFRGPAYGAGWACDDLQNGYGAELSALSINDNVVKVLIRPGNTLGSPCRLEAVQLGAFLSFSNQTRTVQTSQKRTVRLFRRLNDNIVYFSGDIPLHSAAYAEEVPFHDPARVFASVFSEALSRSGIQVEGQARGVDWLERQAHLIHWEEMMELGFVLSPPIADLARAILKPSQNLYANLLLSHLGEKSRERRLPSQETSQELGIRELEKFIVRAGINADEVFFDEGSGLSRNNLTTANATVALLKFVRQQSYAEVFLQGLPLAGVDGTLQNRMKGTPAEGNVRAKTGTLRWVNSLSGTVMTAAGERLLFCVMLNRLNAAGGSPNADIDAIPASLAGLKGWSTDENQ